MATVSASPAVRVFSAKKVLPVKQFEVFQPRNPCLRYAVIYQRTVLVYLRQLKMRIHTAPVEYGKFKPVVRHLDQRACNGREPIAADRLTIRKELLPCIIRARQRDAAALQNRFVDKQAFPIAHDRNGVAFAVGGNRKLCIVHVFCIIRILGTNLVQRHDLSRSDKWLCIRIGEEKEHVRFRTRLKIRQDPGFPFLAGHIGAIGHQISGRGLVGRDGSFKIPAVAVLAAEGGHDPQRHGFRLRRLFPSCAAA